MTQEDKQVKVGDKVRCLENHISLRRGEVYKVHSVCNDGSIGVWNPEENDWLPLDEDEYELIDPETQNDMSGLTKRERAALELRVPNSGTDWLDEMIQQSRRDAFAGQAMANLFMDPWYTDQEGSKLQAREIAGSLSADAYVYADAMLAASDNEGGADS